MCQVGFLGENKNAFWLQCSSTFVLILHFSEDYAWGKNKDNESKKYTYAYLLCIKLPDPKGRRMIPCSFFKQYRFIFAVFFLMTEFRTFNWLICVFRRVVKRRIMILPIRFDIAELWSNVRVVKNERGGNGREGRLV